MALPIVMAQIDGANQVSSILAATGSTTFKVGQVSAATNGGAGNLMMLTPTSGGSAVAVKLEGARQVADLSALVGKTVAIGKPSMMAGVGAGNSWLMFQPVQAGAAKATLSTTTLLKLEGARQGAHAAALTGNEFTVVQPMMAGKGTASSLFLQPVGGGDLVALKMANATPTISTLVGKTVTIGKAPLVAGGNTGCWVALKPTAVATASKAAGGTVAVKAAAPIVKAKSVAMTTMSPAAKVAGGANFAKGAATSATIWNGSGLSLGLGLGLGIWGPVIVAGIGATAMYGYIRSRREEAENDVATID